VRTTRRELLVLAAVAPLVAPTAHADSKLDAALASIAAARAKIATLQGPFTQERTLSLLATRVKSTGQLWLQRPDRLRWELDPPDSVTYWVLPDALAYKSKSGTGKVAKGSSGLLAGVLGDLQIMLGDDLGKLRGRWDVTLLRRDESALALALTPRDKALAKSTSRVELELIGDLGAPRRVQIFEASGDRSDIVFGSMKRGAPIDPKLLAGP
jgi:outer membrane lipoprotein-sorting protein